ncbi:MAG: N-acetyltransferase [Hyphomonadaceae bacterium]|nr:N-acetyltransferase [Hyphomonadaceae bacterium]
MNNLWIRPATEDDAAIITELNDAAFGTPEEAQIVTQLAMDGDSLASLVAHDDRRILGHIQFFRIWVDGADVACGLGPVSAHPDVQGRGIGSGLIRFGLTLMEGAGRSHCFLLGHKDYYPRFGFSAELAAEFGGPWSGPHFMALKLNENGPTSGTLKYPAAFGA